MFDAELEKFRSALSGICDLKELEDIKRAYLGRTGMLNEIRKNTDMRGLDDAGRRQFGESFNSFKRAVESGIEAARVEFSVSLTGEAPLGFDPTLPSREFGLGAIHPISLTQLEVEDIFRGMGFQVVTGDEAVTEYENFDAVNVQGDHPARDMQDTFWLENGMVLRTHTSAMQNRAMKTLGVPLRAIFPGRCFRNEATDQTHENTFYQLEGMMIDEKINVAHLIGVMKELLDKVFQRDIKVRLRPGFFPFVEPGFELDFKTRIGNSERWMELMPCGMMHPEVLREGGVDPQKYSGFAFGLGLTRLAMLKYGIPDVRLFNKCDLRVNAQFTASV